jgi:hypothetical protein
MQAGEQRHVLAPKVTVSQPIQRDVTGWEEYSGYLSAPQSAIVSARVSGLLVDAPFREGRWSIGETCGSNWIRDRSRPTSTNKKAAVEQVKAVAGRTKADFGRSSELPKAGVVSEAEFDSSKAAYGQTAASLNALHAALETSRLNLE